VANDSIYVIGGCGEDPYDRLSTVESYNPATDTWTEEAPLLVGKSQPSVGTLLTTMSPPFTPTIRSTIVAADGWTADADTGDNEGYNASTNSWTPLATDPNPRNGACTGAIGGFLYVAGGNVTSTESFNLSRNTWKTLAPIPEWTQFPGSAVYNGLLYCFGGFGASGGLNNTQIYQP
jgi:N-acetylneuraminic acid mutarotase